MKIKLQVLPLLILSSPILAEEILKGKVIRVADGDTLTLLVDRKNTKVRLAEIDCPERKQPWGNEAKQFLLDKVFKKQISVEKITTDRFKRVVGRVFYNGQNVNRELVEQGHCWVYRKYMKDHSLLIIERQAKKNERGLWQLPENQRVPPWIYRKR